jgi:hypothetical protein
MVIEYFPVGSLMIFILPEVFLGDVGVPDRVVIDDPHGQRLGRYDEAEPQL